jgi:hypothetical protein
MAVLSYKNIGVGTTKETSITKRKKRIEKENIICGNKNEWTTIFETRINTK